MDIRLRIRGVHNLFMETSSKEAGCALVAFSSKYSRLCYHYPELLALCISHTSAVCCMPFNRCHLLACSYRNGTGLNMWKQIDDIVQLKIRGGQYD